MRAKYQSPAGSSILELPDNTTVRDLFNQIASRTGIAEFTLQYGPPSSTKVLDRRHFDQMAKAIGLNSQVLTVVPENRSSPSLAKQAVIAAPQIDSADKAKRPEDIAIPWPEREGTVVLRVMPSDNSCLFTAFGGALPQQIPAQQLRRMMADYIQHHPDIFSQAVLGCSPAAYCMGIQTPDRWGGGIELSILSSIFDIEICTYDVQAQKLIRFGELKKDRCILIFSGIHYDRVGFSFSEYPHQHTLLPPEMDRTIWPIGDDEILEKTEALVKQLHAAHYFTDAEGLILKCDVPGCDWVGSGQVAGKQHAEKTGHQELSEILDVQEEGVLQRCETPGCDFIGQGIRASSRHTLDTGHEKLSVIPDA